jgi:hypothetical protein
MDTQRKVTIPDAALIRARYEKQLILRLVQVCDAIVSDTPDLAQRTNFSGLWSSAMNVPSQGLILASRQPLLDAWVSTTERLVRNGIHKRYPDAHPARHLKSFSGVLLSWAAYLPDKTRGEISVVGPQVVQLFHGNLLLVGNRNTMGTLSWEVKGRSLEVGEKGKEPIVVTSLSDWSNAVVSDEDWRLIRTPQLKSILIDSLTPEYHRGYATSPRPVFLEQELRKVFAELDEEVSAMVQTTCRCMTQLPKLVEKESRPHQWIAGLVRLPATGFGMQVLVEAACRDLIERMLTIKPLSGPLGGLSLGSDFRPLVIELTAERLASRLLGDASKADGDAGKWQHWPRVLSRLSQSEDGLSFLEQLGEDTRNLTPAAAKTVPSAVPPPKSEPLRPVLPAQLVFTKTRKDSAFSIDDFSALAAIGEVDRDELTRHLPRLMEAVQQSEEQAFYAAAAAYSLGHFEQCVEALSWCLKFDTDVEEYWHILAFALRYLGRRDEFNMIVFAGVRDAARVEALR